MNYIAVGCDRLRYIFFLSSREIERGNLKGIKFDDVFAWSVGNLEDTTIPVTTSRINYLLLL